jgi:hypothetical protein
MKIIIYTALLLLAPAAFAGDLEGCMSRIKMANGIAKSGQIKLHPQAPHEPVIAIKGAKLSEKDGLVIYDALKFCAAQGMRAHYAGREGKPLNRRCTVINLRSGAMSCQEVPAELQPKEKLIQLKKLEE